MPAVVDLHVSVAAAGVGGNVKLVGLTAEHVKPDGTLSVSEMVPVKPFTPVRITVSVGEEPTITPDEALGLIASAICSQYHIALSPKLTERFDTVELSVWYSDAAMPGIRLMKPEPGVNVP